VARTAEARVLDDAGAGNRQLMTRAVEEAAACSSPLRPLAHASGGQRFATVAVVVDADDPAVAQGENVEDRAPNTA